MPTLAIQVIVDHTTKIMAVSNCFPGSHTDITIARLDSQINSIRFDPVFVDYPFSVYVQPGVSETQFGSYLIADGGYQFWRVFQMTDKTNTEPRLRGFLAQVASSRKDVECTFGRIKNRFRFVYCVCL